MITIIHGLEIHIITLLLLGLSVGVISGFTGVGGGFIVTPALIVMGLPAELAVGTSLFWAFLNALVGLITHRNYGNTDIKLGIAMAIPSLLGVEAGVRLTKNLRCAGLQDLAILSVSIILMILVGSYTLIESIRRKAFLDQLDGDRQMVPFQLTVLAKKFQTLRIPPMVVFKRSKITISIWIILALGFIIGMTVGLTGTGAGFITVPALIYLIGIPAPIAVGSNLLQVLLSYSYGSLRYFATGNIGIPVALAILSTSLFGVIYGASVTRYVRGVTVRLVLGITITIVCSGSVFKLLGLVFTKNFQWLGILANIIIFTGMGLVMLLVFALNVLARRYIAGKRIPRQLESLCQDNR
jgi:uncharacterized membrane protein YfcA